MNSNSNELLKSKIEEQRLEIEYLKTDFANLQNILRLLLEKVDEEEQSKMVTPLNILTKKRVKNSFDLCGND